MNIHFKSNDDVLSWVNDNIPLSRRIKELQTCTEYLSYKEKMKVISVIQSVCRSMIEDVNTLSKD